VLGCQLGEGETHACGNDRGSSEISYVDSVLNKVSEFKLTMISIVMM
jgi:hypothetical protein